MVKHYFDKSGATPPPASTADGYIIHTLTQTLNRGVELFFAISGFILALPFASVYLKGTQKPKLKNYFLRRLTRLEPPYVISLILFFLLNYLSHHNTFNELVPHFFASLFYVHNFVYAPALPLLNGVTWSLEIEVQFYILAPLITAVFKIKNKVYRRLLVTSIIIAFILLNTYVSFGFRSILSYFQYFFVGFLVADFYLEDDHHFFNLNATLQFLFGAAVLCLLFFYPKEMTGVKFIVPLTVFLFFYCCMFSRYWKAVVKLKFIMLTGGMCYSIYLLHVYVAALLDRIDIAKYIHAGFYPKLLFHTAVTCFLILVISSIYFILIERPCMDKDWVKKLLKKFRRSDTAVTTA